MAYEPTEKPTGFADDFMPLELDDEFDPLAVDDLAINQEDMDDDNPLDTIDYPTMRNMPETMQRQSVYTPERQGSAQQAILELLDHNPARRPVLLSIINLCQKGCRTSALSQQVEQLQQDNRSVYAPTTLCRMLERAGALELEMPPVAHEQEDEAAGVQYLEITQRVDPIWHATQAGLEVYENMTQGAAFRNIVLDRDSKYGEVYCAVMQMLNDHPCSKAQIEALVDTFEVVKNPRRFGGHFIDMLERTDALTWHDRAWCLTDLGREMLPEVEDLAHQIAARGTYQIIEGNASAATTHTSQAILAAAVKEA